MTTRATFPRPHQLLSSSTHSPTRSCGSPRLQVFIEPDAISERVDHLDALGIVKRRIEPRPKVLVVLAGDFSVESVNPRHPDEDRRAWAAVAVMLGQV